MKEPKSNAIAKIKKAAALSYDQDQDAAPRVVARGAGLVAQKIVDLAAAHNIPVREDPNLAQMLAALDVNTEIPAELYQAVAQVLVFIYRMNAEYPGPEA